MTLLRDKADLPVAPYAQVCQSRQKRKFPRDKSYFVYMVIMGKASNRCIFILELPYTIRLRHHTRFADQIICFYFIQNLLRNLIFLSTTWSLFDQLISTN